MPVNKICVGCKWNEYPLCNGTIIDGVKMNIENLNISFQCGVKIMENPLIITVYMEIKKSYEQIKIEELENQITDLETKNTDLETKNTEFEARIFALENP